MKQDDEASYSLAETRDPLNRLILAKDAFLFNPVWHVGLYLNAFRVVSLKQGSCFFEAKMLSYRTSFEECTYMSLTTGHIL